MDACLRDRMSETLLDRLLEEAMLHRRQLSCRAR